MYEYIYYIYIYICIYDIYDNQDLASGVRALLELGGPGVQDAVEAPVVQYIAC